MDENQEVINSPFPERPQQSDMIDNYPTVVEENQMMKSLLSDENIPEKILKKYWWVFSKDVVLSFLDKQGKEDKMRAFDISKIDYLATLPYYEYNFEQEQELNNLRNIYDTKTDRAKGSTNTGLINERIAQKSQFNESRQFVNDGTTNSVKGGFLSKLLNRK